MRTSLQNGSRDRAQHREDPVREQPEQQTHRRHHRERQHHRERLRHARRAGEGSPREEAAHDGWEEIPRRQQRRKQQHARDHKPQRAGDVRERSGDEIPLAEKAAEGRDTDERQRQQREAHHRRGQPPPETGEAVERLRPGQEDGRARAEKDADLGRGVKQHLQQRAEQPRGRHEQHAEQHI